MTQPERRDLHAVEDPFDDYNRYARAHNDARFERSLMDRARQFADMRSQEYVRERSRQLDRMEADHALQVARGAMLPPAVTIDAEGWPTMTEEAFEAANPRPTPPPAPPHRLVDGEETEETDDPDTAEVPAVAPEVVPRRRKNEDATAWASRILEANPGRTIGWRRLRTLVGGNDVLRESRARTAVENYRVGTAG